MQKSSSVPISKCFKMVKLYAVLVLVIFVNYSSAYFGKPVKSKQAATVRASIQAVTDQLATFKKYFDLMSTIEKDSTATGSTVYSHVLTLVDKFTTNVDVFLNSLGESALSENLPSSIIIANTETLITQLIEQETIVVQIGDAILLGGLKWFSYLPKFGPVAKGISNDLKTIFGALIVICDTHRTAAEVDSADQQMVAKLQDLLQQMASLDTFYAKIRDIDNYVDKKISDFNDARKSFENIFDESLADYNERLLAASNGIVSRNLLLSKAFKTGMLEKSGNLLVDYDVADGNLLIDGMKYDFKSRYLTPIQQTPTHLKNKIDELSATITDSISHVPDHINVTKQVIIKLLYNTAKGQDIVDTYNCIMSAMIGEQYDQLISDALTGLRTVASYAYFSVVPFSNPIVKEFYSVVNRIIVAIKPQTTKIGAKNAFEMVSLMMS